MMGCDVMGFSWARRRRVRSGNRRLVDLSTSHLPFDQLQLELGNGLGRIETLGTGFGAVHNGVATIEPERVLEIIEPFAGGFVAAVRHPAVCLKQRRGTEKALAVPPIARA